LFFKDRKKTFVFPLPGLDKSRKPDKMFLIALTELSLSCGGCRELADGASQ
jgi:hypothetical protein